jgi:hypothetical protein
METKVIELEATVTQLKNQLKQHDSLFISLQRERPTTSCECLTLLSRSGTIDGIGSSSVTFSGMPSSCEDLGLIGHTLSGLYSVMGTEQVETVYCDFSKLPGETSKLH